MYFSYEFKDEVDKKAILIDGKHYSDKGMMWGELSNITGIDINTLSMYDDWYILDDEYYYFKATCIFEELFMSELAKECNVKGVSFGLAKNTVSYKYPTIGVISKLYRSKDNEYFYYSDFCSKYFGEYALGMDKFRLFSEDRFGSDNSNKLMDDIYGMIAFDMFTGQRDRGEHNFMFECNGDNIRLAPLCDNGLIFGNGYDYDCPFDKLCLFETDMFSSYRKSLIDILKCEKMLYERFEHILDIDIRKVLKRTLDKYMIVMDIGSKRRILRYMDGKKKAIDESLKYSRR